MAADVTIFYALIAGLVSFLSPCVLPLVPPYLVFLAGTSLERLAEAEPERRVRRAAVLGATLFVAGFSTVFVALGVSASAISRVLLSYRYEAGIVGGLIVIIFGVFMTGLVPMPWLQRDFRYHGGLRGGRPAGAYVLGLAFGFGWTPCIGPILGAILTLGALSSTAYAGTALLAAYSLGLGVPFLVSAIFTDSLLRWRKKMGRAGQLLQFGAGGVMIIMGLAMITGTLNVFSFWLLDNIPILQKIG